MFEVKCPSCNASYQVDERRVPPTGLKMRCPKCGESFQVSSPAHSEPPVLGAALGLKKDVSVQPPRHKKTMLGVAAQGAGTVAPPEPAARPGPPRAAAKKTMMGLAPAGSQGFELASLEDDQPREIDADEFDLVSGRGDGDALDLAGVSNEGEVDLPMSSSRSRKVDGGIDLPSVIGTDPDEADLPSLGGGLPDLGDELDLPSRGETELPDLGVGLPDLAAGLPDLGAALPGLGGNLPAVGGNLPAVGGNLPAVGGNLPAMGGKLPSLASGLPELRGAQGVVGGLDPFGDGDEAEPASLEFDDGGGFDLSSPPPAAISSRPPPGMEADDIFGKGPTHAPKSVHPPRKGDPSAFGEVDFGGGDASPLADDSDAEEFDAFPTETGPSDKVKTSGAGYGDVTLDGGGGALDLGEEPDRGPAPAGAPTAGAAAATAQVRLPITGAKEAKPKKERRQTSALSRATRVALGGVLLFAIAGGALALLPDIGPYGSYFIIDTLKADEHRTHLAADIKRANQLLMADTAGDVSLAFSEVETGRKSAPRYKPRKAYAAYIGFFHQLRFGASSSESTQAQVHLDELKEVDPSTEHLALAQLAHQAATGGAETVAKSADRHIKRGIEFAALVGEAGLAAKDANVAQKAFAVVLGAGPSARGHFGMARALQLANQPEEARKHMDDTLRLNASHAGARLLIAQALVRSRAHDQDILKSLTPLSEGKGASRGEQVQALVTLGDLHLTRARLKKAEESFQKALKLDAGSAAAQRGLAQTLFESGRIGEALARFEASLQKDPKDLAANLGLVQCKLKLEKLDDAVKHLMVLQKEHPKSSAVAYFEGVGRESIGEKAAAQKAFERAIELGDDSQETVLSYIALTRLLGQQGKLEAAAEIIAQAEKKFPEDPTVYEALGELSTSRGSFDEAVRDYDKALALDPENIGLRFARGIALRKARRFDEATAEFDRVEKESSDYPGLALERGNLYQAAGKSEEALRAYEKALAAAPDDKDLMLNVACGRAEAGQAEPALQLLAPVLEERSTSAEVNFCQGLALLNKKDFAQAKVFLERAVSGDATRAKYHLYVGWIALEMNDLAQAQTSLDKTIDLDRTLADAYWKRGVLRVKTAAVKDALSDLGKALELAPHRLEAHASAARAYEQIGREPDALEAWSKAMGAPQTEPVWHYQYGKLLYVNNRVPEAREQLEKAITLGEKEDPGAVWLPEAHRHLAMTIGRNKEAIPHWQAFLKVRHGTNDPYVREALSTLKAILDTTGN